jgi:hypothetical protein
MKVHAFHFDIEYVKGKKNIVANALSRRPAACSLMEISADWKSHLLVEYSKNKFACEVMDGQIHDDRYRVIDDVIFYKDRVYLVPDSGLKRKILIAVHESICQISTISFFIPMASSWVDVGIMVVKIDFVVP